MKMFILLLLFYPCQCYKILALFPSYGRSHHIFFSPLLEELAARHHDVTVVNYHPMKNLSTLHQIRFQIQVNTTKHKIKPRNDIMMLYNKLLTYKTMANLHCRRLTVENPEIQRMVRLRVRFDVVLVEQFVSDCGLAVAYMLGAPTVGMTAHILYPWTYSRLGAPLNPSFVPNYFFASGSNPNLFKRIKSALVNFAANTYYSNVIQRSDQAIVNKLFPDVPPLEILGRNMSLIMLNQYHALTGSRVYGANVIEIGGLHINESEQIEDQDLKMFLDTASNDSGIVYISFGSILSEIPHQIIHAIIKLTQKSNLKFVWKTDKSDWAPPSNVFIRKWLPQVPILYHPSMKAFITHSGMLSTSEAIHCGVPVVSIPLCSDEFANAQSALENGLGITVDVREIDEDVLENALEIVFQDSYQSRAKQLSQMWKDRPMSPMDTAVFWIEHVARHKGAVNLRPTTVELPLYQYLMLDVLLVLALLAIMICFILIKAWHLLSELAFAIRNIRRRIIWSENRSKKID